MNTKQSAPTTTQLWASRQREWIATLPLLVPGLVAGVVILLILVVILQVAFQEGGSGATGAWTLENFRIILQDPAAFRTLVNTFWFTIIVVITSLFLGIPIAWLVERTNLPARNLVYSLLTLILLIPGFFPAMAWMFLLHPRIGIVNQWLVSVLPISQSPLNIGTIPGMGFVQGLSLVPLAFIMVAPAFRNMDPSLEESAQIHGARLWDRLWTITLPLMWPSILAAGLFIFALGIAVFDVPAFLGMGNRVFTLSTFMYVRVQPLDSIPNYGLVGAIATFGSILAIFISFWYLRTIRLSYRYAVISGKAYRPQRIDLGRWWIAGWVFIGLIVFLSVLMPVALLTWAALIPFLTIPSPSAFALVSLDNFRDAPWGIFWKAVKNTGILMFVVPTVTTIIALTMSWVIIRSKTHLSWLFDLVSFLPHVIPNMIFALGILFIALFWLPVWVPFYGTIGILIVINVVTRIPFATRMYNSTLLQTNKELDEAGYVSGLGAVNVLLHILRPLLTPSILYTWLWVSLLAYRELTMAAFLSSRENTTLPVLIFNIWIEGSLNQAAAISLAGFLVAVPLIVLYLAMGRRALFWQE